MSNEGTRACAGQARSSCLRNLDVDQLYRRYAPMVLWRAREILKDEHAARDATQDVFVRVLRNAASFRGDASLATWLYRMTTNLCLNIIRDDARHRDRISSSTMHEDGLRAVAPDQRIACTRVLASAPAELREIAVYYFVVSMKQHEIARALGISRRTVGNRIDAFKAHARAAMSERASGNRSAPPSR